MCKAVLLRRGMISALVEFTVYCKNQTEYKQTGVSIYLQTIINVMKENNRVL